MLTLWFELSIAALIVPTLALTHGLGLLGMSHMFNLTDDALLHKRLSPRSILLVAFMAILLFTLHSIEIGAVGLLYLFGGACRTLTRDKLAAGAGAKQSAAKRSVAVIRIARLRPSDNLTTTKARPRPERSLVSASL